MCTVCSRVYLGTRSAREIIEVVRIVFIRRPPKPFAAIRLQHKIAQPQSERQAPVFILISLFSELSSALSLSLSLNPTRNI